MTTNQEWLFSLTLEEYLKWMESEHSEPKDDASSYGADFKAVEMDASRFEAVEMDASRLVVNEPDSREKLEADVRKHYAYSTTTLMYPPSANKTTDMLRALPVDTVIGWLDRQAAITKRETLHDNPTCSGRSTCASKDEIRDVDIWNVAYEIYCAGGYVDNGNEPNPPTDGIRKLLDRQAEITREEADAGCNECFTEARKREHTLGEAIDGLTEQVDELTAERDKLKEEIVKYGHDCTLLFDEKHKLTAERDQLTKAINELQKKQPYCYNPEQPLDTLNEIGRYIDELKTRSRDLVNDLVRVRDERNNLKLNNLQLHTLAGEQAATIDELTAERDNLKELNEYHAHQYELASEDIDRMHAQVDELNATIGKLQKQVNELMIR